VNIRYALFVVLLALPAAAAARQAPAEPLAGLIAEVRAANPQLQAARRMVDAAAARVPQAGALPDPVVSAGVMNVAVRDPAIGRDEMAMASFQVAQMLPPPGARAAREAAAVAGLAAAQAEAAHVELTVVTRLKAAYYEAYFIAQAVDVLRRNRELLENFAAIAASRFAVGAAPQQDVLRAHTEVSRIDEQLAGLEARRAAVTAEANALLARPALQPLTPVYPAGTNRLARTLPARGAFTAAALDAALGEGLPTLAELQEVAWQLQPALQSHGFRVEQARAGVRLAQRERFPDVEVMLGYGTPGGAGMDRFTAMVSVPVPVFARRKQRQLVVEAAAELAAAELEHHGMMNEAAAEVAARYAEVVRIREQIVLLSEGVVPQARATIESAAVAYQAGRVEFVSLLDAQAALFRNEIELARQLADFGRALAELERATGRELKLEG
jgi:outer membrane protein, heavy metal efflux system